MSSWKTFVACLGFGIVVVGFGAAPPASELESPDFDECFEWKYPDKDICGELKGVEECKASPTIESSTDEKKKAECKPTKGEECLCE